MNYKVLYKLPLISGVGSDVFVKECSTNFTADSELIQSEFANQLGVLPDQILLWQEIK